MSVKSVFDKDNFEKFILGKPMSKDWDRLYEDNPVTYWVYTLYLKENEGKKKEQEEQKNDEPTKKSENFESLKNQAAEYCNGIATQESEDNSFEAAYEVNSN